MTYQRFIRELKGLRRERRWQVQSSLFQYGGVIRLRKTAKGCRNFVWSPLTAVCHKVHDSTFIPEHWRIVSILISLHVCTARTIAAASDGRTHLTRREKVVRRDLLLALGLKEVA